MDEEQAALKLQKIQRGNSARADFRDIRDEEARKQWVDYYVAVGNYAEARELGFQGEEAAEPVTREVAVSVPKPIESGEAATTGPMLVSESEAKEKAALLVQAATRGKAARDEYRDMRDEEARKQWVAYYIAAGDYAQARELGWDEEEDQQAEAATKLAAVRKGQMARRSLTGSSSEEVDDEPVLVEAASESAINGDGSADPDEEDGEKWGQARENELALQEAEAAIPIFSARWFGQVWDALKPKDEMSPADKFDEREKAAAVIVQCWARVVLARVAVKNEGRKYRLLALYAHIEDKNAMKIQHAFRNKQSSAADIAAAALVEQCLALFEQEELEQVAASVAANAIAAGAAMATAEEGAMAAAASAMPTKVNVANASMPVPAGMPPAVESKGAPRSPPQGLPPVDKALSLAQKVAEIQANHAATVMQKVQREAAKAEQVKKLQGALFKRSLQVPRYQRRWMYVSNSTVDGLALCYREKDKDGSKTESIEKRIPLASITEIALVSEAHYEFSVDSTIRSKKYLFRSETRAELEMWTSGLAELAPP